MSKTNKQSASQVEQAPGFEGRYADLDGYVVGFETLHRGPGRRRPCSAGCPTTPASARTGAS